jgi:hypothetical protein
VFAELLPIYQAALQSGLVFDYELLYVRLLEFGDRLDRDALDAIARSAVERMVDGGFDAADSVAALRFAIRVLPADEPFLDSLMQSSEQEALCFQLTVDFVLDARELDEYLAVSYLRDGDPEADAVLRRHPIPEVFRRRIERFFAPESCRERIEQGWRKWGSKAEYEELAGVLRKRIPELRIEGAAV